MGPVAPGGDGTGVLKAQLYPGLSGLTVNYSAPTDFSVNTFHLEITAICTVLSRFQISGSWSLCTRSGQGGSCVTRNSAGTRMGCVLLSVAGEVGFQ